MDGIREYETYGEALGLFTIPKFKAITPKGTIPSDKQKCQSKQQHKFSIKGVEIMAASRKDAIKKFNHLKGKKV